MKLETIYENGIAESKVNPETYVYKNVFEVGNGKVKIDDE